MRKSIAVVLIIISFISFAFMSPIRSFALQGMLNKHQKLVNKQERKKLLPAVITEKDVYICPMHPGVISEKPGKCTECGMNLVIKKKGKAVFTCPMHADVVSDKPGKCPKCKMNLEKKVEGKTEMPIKK